ncbi:DUF6950 family protein [Phenylobacterium terrae]|uniref:DUF6950 family protein n=1 Tax=Phenylobacterium terrae TaxID=2665495 RepID=A0ABW4N756_9CAUL
MEPIKRRNAAQAVFDKYFNTPFELGTHDCVHLAAYDLVQLGHDDPLISIGPYETVRGARKALKKAGWSSLEDYLDARGFQRIPPAAALPGDIVGFKETRSVAGLALGVALSGGKVMAYVNGGCCYGPPDDGMTAWRIPPAEAHPPVSPGSEGAA